MEPTDAEVQRAMGYMRDIAEGKPNAKGPRSPITVRENTDGTYTIIDGKATYTAAKEFGWTSLPVEVVKDERSPLAHLSNEEISGVVDHLLKQYAEVAPEFQKNLVKIGKAVGLTSNGIIAPQGVKSKDRILEKVEEKKAEGKATLEEAVWDIVRGTLIVNSQDEMQTAINQINDIYLIINAKNRFEQPTPEGYSDILLNVDLGNGKVGEIQIHVQEMIDAKKVGHDDYKISRKLSAIETDRLTEEEQAELDASIERQVQHYSEARDAFTKRTNSSFETLRPSIPTSSRLKTGGSESNLTVAPPPSDVRKPATGISSTAIKRQTGSSYASSRDLSSPDEGLTTDKGDLKISSKESISKPSVTQTEAKIQEDEISEEEAFDNALAALIAEKRPTAGEDDGFSEIDEIMGFGSASLKQALETEQPLFESQYVKLRPAFEKVLAKFDATDRQERMTLFVKALNDRYTLDAIAKLKPYVVRFMKENPLQAETNESIKKIDVETRDKAADQQIGRGSSMPNDDARSAQYLGAGQPGPVTEIGEKRPTDTTDEGPDAGTGHGTRLESGASVSRPGKLRDTSVSGATPARSNFLITTELDFDRFSQKTRYQKNVEAIKLLMKLDDEKRLATPEEQGVLAQYVGWGGLKQAFDARNPNWAKEFAELKKLLPDGEYEKARRSILNAHFTSKPVVNAICSLIDIFEHRFKVSNGTASSETELSLGRARCRTSGRLCVR